VLANGTIVNANKTSNPDLHHALKGGGNNLGIVTSFDVETFPNAKIWGGFSIVFNQQKEVMKWFYKFSNSVTADPDAMTLLFLMPPTLGQTVSMALTTHTKPIQNPKIFSDLNRLAPNTSNMIFSLPQIFQNIPNLLTGGSVLPRSSAGLPNQTQAIPQGFDIASGKMNGLTSIFDLAKFNSMGMGSGATAGVRAAFYSFSYINSPDYLEKLMDLLSAKNKDLPLLSSAMIGVQPFHRLMRQSGIQTGGPNALGLDDMHPNDDLVVVLLTVSWFQESRDDVVQTWSKNFITSAQKLATDMKAYSPYIYMNYAYDGQNVISGYSPRAQRFLQQVSQQYDPYRVFQTQVPGGFKLPKVI
jgi:hypothetical protein